MPIQCALGLLPLIAILLSPPGLSVAGHSQTSFDYSSLSGTWSGSLSLQQRGDCKVNGKRRSNLKMELLFDVAADGSFRAVVTPTGAKGSRDVKWEGRFFPDMSVIAEQP